MRPFDLSRRGVLSLMAAAGGSGMLQSLAGRLAAHAAPGAPVKRLVLVKTTWGTAPKFFTSPGWSETNFPLRDMLLPFAPFQSKLTIINNMKSRAAGDGLHGNPGIFTGSDWAAPNQAQHPSVEQYIAAQIGASDRIPCLALADDLQNAAGSYTPLLQPATPFTSAAAAFAAAFGSGPAVGADAGVAQVRALEQKVAVLDYSVNEVRAFRNRLASSERLKLDQYLNGIELVQRQVAPAGVDGGGGPAPRPVTCQTPMAGPFPTLPPGKLSNGIRATYSTENCEATFQVLAQALICGVTRVAFVNMASRPPALNTPNANGNVFQYHSDAQHGNNAVLQQQQNRYWVERIASFWSQLRAAPEGAGTVADNTLVVWMPTTGSHHGGAYNVPAFMLGDAGGAFRAGRHLRYAPDDDRNNLSPQTPNNLFVSLANAMGVQTNTFGDPAYCTGPLPNLV
jgi:hypothetical protein